MNDILSEAEIVELTGKVRHYAQRKALTAMGIRFTPRPGRTASLIVLRAHRDAVLGLRKTQRPVEQAAAPNFAALD